MKMPRQTRNKKTIRIMAWNANGILKQKNELEAIINRDNIDICLISETHLTNQMFTTLKNYTIYCANHPRNCARGGSAIIVKSNIEHHEEQHVCSEEFQAASITIKNCGTDLTVTAIYSPPRNNIKSEEYVQLLKMNKGRFVIGGDFNAKHVFWGSRLTTTKGRELLKATKELGCDILSTGNPTYWPADTNKIPDLIDFFITKQISRNSMYVEDGTDMNSDHSPIYLIIDGELQEQERNQYLSNKHTDWLYFKHKLENCINPVCYISNTNDIDTETEKLTSEIQNAAWLSTPSSKPRIFKQPYPQDILDLINYKRKIRKKWQTTRLPSIKTQLNNLTKLLQEKTKQYKNQTFTKKIENLSAEKISDYSLWKTTSNLKRQIVHNPPIKTQCGNWARNDLEKAEAFASHLQETFQSHPSETDDFQAPIVVQESDEIQHFSLSEVLAEIKKLKPGKSPGFDLITADVLKNLPMNVLEKLKTIMNACLDHKYVPYCWKFSEIIMIQKPGKQANSLSSYRPISLLPVIGKLFEKLFLKRLKDILIVKQLIPSHQFGFREKHSTIDQVHRIAYSIEEALEQKKVCSAVFLDVAQAFDKVWHTGLEYKLKTQLPVQYTSLLKSYMEDRYFRVKQKQAYSNIKKIEAGVPQGSVLGPTLYLLYTSDIPHPNDCIMATFADDTCILASGNDEIESSTKLQRSVDIIAKWTDTWRIKLNESKSTHIDFTNKTVEYRPVQIYSSTIPHSNCAKYLGMTLDVKLKWKEHIKIKAKELNLKYSKLKWLIGRKSVLSIENKLLIYNQVLKPIWTYGAQLWGCASANQLETIQQIQNKIIRNMVNAPWFIRNNDLHRDLGVMKVDEVIKSIATIHAARLEQHINQEANILRNDGIYTRRLKRNKPQDLMAALEN